MKHREVKQLLQQLSVLLNYIVKSGIDIFHLNYGLNRNLEILTKAVEAIDKGISPELRELETKINKLGEEKKEQVRKINEDNSKLKEAVKSVKDISETPTYKLTEKGLKEDIKKLKKADKTIDEVIILGKDILEKDSFEVGLSFSTPEENARHAELMVEYNLALEEESDVELYMLNMDKLEAAGLKMEFTYMSVLSKFIK